MKNEKKVVRYDHNYKNRSPKHENSEDIHNELQSLKKAYRRLKDKIADSVGLTVELQSEDLEDVRVSTKVADRFDNLACASEKNAIVKDTIDALKPFAYSHKQIVSQMSTRLKDLEKNLEAKLQIMSLSM